MMSGSIIVLYGVLFLILATRSFQKTDFTSTQRSHKKNNKLTKPE